MTEKEYKEKYYPQDFILIQNEFFPLPKGGKIQVQQKEIANTFTTADGTKRKDIISRKESASIKFSFLLEKDFNSINEIIQKLEHTFYDDKKKLCLKNETMPTTPSEHCTTLFKHIEINIISPIKYTYSFRKNGMFIYSGVNLKIN